LGEACKDASRKLAVAHKLSAFDGIRFQIESCAILSTALHSRFSHDTNLRRASIISKQAMDGFFGPEAHGIRFSKGHNGNAEDSHAHSLRLPTNPLHLSYKPRQRHPNISRTCLSPPSHPFPAAVAPSLPHTGCLHTGHEPLHEINHRSTHGAWNPWRHGSVRTACPPSYPPRQIVQRSASASELSLLVSV